MDGLKLAEMILNYERDFEVASSDYATPAQLEVIERDRESASNRLKNLAGDNKYSSLMSRFRHYRNRQYHQYDSPASILMSRIDYKELDKVEKELRALVEEN